jgi:hypothetical protein
MVSYAYTATRTLAVDLDFKCQACGYASPVRVEATGAGYQGGVSGKHNQAVGQQVVAQAAEGARRLARVFVELCPCPKCGKRDAVAAGGFKRRNWIVGGVSGAILLVGAVLIALSVWIPGIVLALFGLIAVIVTPAMAMAIWGNAKRKVHFPVEGAASGALAE